MQNTITTSKSISEHKKKPIRGNVKQFSCNSFFRQIDLSLLRELFNLYEISDKKIFEALEEKSREEIIESYKEIDLNKILEFEQQAAFINDFNGDYELPELVEIAKELKLDLDKTALNLACEIFLKYPNRFESIKHILQAEHSKGFIEYIHEPFELDINESKIKTMEDKFRKFSRELGCGRKVKIEKFDYSDRIILLVWSEGFLKPKDKFNEEEEIINKEERDLHRLTIICHPNKGKLRVKAETNDWKNFACSCFGEIFLNDKKFFSDNFKAILDLDKFREPIFEFPVNKEQIEWFKLTGIKCKYRNLAKNHLELRVNDIYEILEERNVDLKDNNLEIVRVWLAAKIVGRSRTRNFELGVPNTIKLDNTNHDAMIEEHLENWGVICGYQQIAQLN